MKPPLSQTLTVLFTDLVDSTKIEREAGTAAYAEILNLHNQLFETTFKPFEEHGGQILEHTGDGYLATFTSAADGVRFALAFQRAMREFDWKAEESPVLQTRIGLHVGEVALITRLGRSAISGGVVNVASRVMSLGRATQVLLSGDVVKQAEPLLRKDKLIEWMDHGRYEFKGGAEPLGIWEVGEKGAGPFCAPPDAEKAWRAKHANAAWIPAVDAEIPGRPGWVLKKPLGEGTYGTTWLAVHRQSKRQQAFKFCSQHAHARTLKREVTAQGALADRKDIAGVLDGNYEQPPYFVQMEYFEAGDLQKWMSDPARASKWDIEDRIRFVAELADAVCAAHQVGVIHRDIKPANVLIRLDAAGKPHPVLADFGIAAPDSGGNSSTLKERMGMTLDGETPLHYRDLEYAGTTTGDIYSLGVILWQVVTGKLDRPAVDYEVDKLEDELLRSDIHKCMRGKPEERFGSAAILADALRTREIRREELRVQRELERAAAEAETKAKETALLKDHVEKLKLANQETAEVTSFLIDLLEEADPAKRLGKPLSVSELLTIGIHWLEDTFKAHPLLRARLLEVMSLLLRSTGRSGDAERLSKESLELRRRVLGEEHPDTITSLKNYALVLDSLGRSAEAEPLYKQALELSRRVAGEEHPRTISSLNNYAFVLDSLGRSAEAEPLHKRALELNRRVLGEEHPETIRSLNNYAGVLDSLGRSEEAEPLYKQALELRRRVLGEEHPNTITSLNNYAGVLGSLGRLAEAEPLARRAVELAAKHPSLGPKHPHSRLYAGVWAAILTNLGRDSEAGEGRKKFDLETE